MAGKNIKNTSVRSDRRELRKTVPDIFSSEAKKRIGTVYRFCALRSLALHSKSVKASFSRLLVCASKKTQAGARGIASYDESEAQGCSRVFDVFAVKQAVVRIGITYPYDCFALRCILG